MAVTCVTPLDALPIPPHVSCYPARPTIAFQCAPSKALVLPPTLLALPQPSSPSHHPAPRPPTIPPLALPPPRPSPSPVRHWSSDLESQLLQRPATGMKKNTMEVATLMAHTSAMRAHMNLVHFLRTTHTQVLKEM